MVLLFLIVLPWISKITSEYQQWDFDTLNNYSTYLYGTLPFTCVIANLLVQKEYVEGGAREVLLKDNADIAMAIINTILQILMFLPICLYFDDSSGNVTNLLSEIFMIIFLMNGIGMAATYLTREPAITVLITLGYTVISNGKMFELISEAAIPWRITAICGEGVDSPYYLNFLIAGMIAWSIGITLAAKRRVV